MARQDPRARREPALDAPPLPGDTGEGDIAAFPHLAEWLRRAALGLLALLVVARAYYPSEDAEKGSGLVWVLMLLGVAGIAVASGLMAGTTRFRWSGVDLAVYALVILVGLSAGHAADRRAAITMAWEWGGIGLAYALARNLPRSRGESAAFAAVLVATATAVAAYGLYQAEAEFPRLRAMFRANPAAILAPLEITPGTPAAESFAHRVLDSNEPFSTFALANSLAGFIVGPLTLLLAVGLDNLRGGRTKGEGSRATAFLLAMVPAALLLVCLLLTKSRSAVVGLAAALLVLGWSYRTAIPRRWLLGSALGLIVVLAGLIAAGLATQKLDVQVLTEARKSLGYRWEYWVGTWGMITDAPPPFAATPSKSGAFGSFTEPTATSARNFWWGVGPANFAGPYLRHKLPEASEEIQDPHNLILEVWAESGLLAALALVTALGWGIVLITSTSTPHPLEDGATSERITQEVARTDLWLILMGGLGWFGVWVLGQLDPIRQPDMTVRWLVLGAAWPTTILLIYPLWNRRPIPAIGLGVATLAVGINLLAAGGIGIPAVALGLWLGLALGLNLRDERASSRLREARGLGGGVALACGWAVLMGTFYGAVIPGWRSEQELAEGEVALANRPPRYDEARNAFARAIEADHYAVRPWLALAALEYRAWGSTSADEADRARVADKGKGDAKHYTTWTRVLLTFDKALEANYRDPDNLELRRLQASYARKILSQLPDDAKPFELLGLRSTIAKATRQAVRLYPTSASLRAELAQASADLGMYADAAAEARTALQLDGITPHLDKKLPGNLHSYLTARIADWDEQAKAPPPSQPTQ